MKKIVSLSHCTLMLFLAFANHYAQEEQKAEPMKPVLIVIDTQNKYLPYMSDEDKNFAFGVINYAISMFRQHEFPIIRVYHTDPAWGPVPNTEDFEFPEKIAVTDDDPKIIKTYSNAFNKTDLEKVIKELEGNTLFLCGLSAVGCVLATYHGAKDRDYDVFLVKGALMSHNSTYTKFVEDVYEPVGLNALKLMLENSKK